MFCNKMISGDNLEVTCTFLTTCTVNNTKLKAQQEINIFEGMKVSHSALESKTDSNYEILIYMLHIWSIYLILI